MFSRSFYLYFIYMFLSCFYVRIRQFITCYSNCESDRYWRYMKKWMLINTYWLLVLTELYGYKSLPGILHCRKSSKNWTLELFLFTTYWIKYWTNKEWCSTFESHTDSKYQGKQGSVSSPTSLDELVVYSAFTWRAHTWLQGEYHFLLMSC